MLTTQRIICATDFHLLLFCRRHIFTCCRTVADSFILILIGFATLIHLFVYLFVWWGVYLCVCESVISGWHGSRAVYLRVEKREREWKKCFFFIALFKCVHNLTQLNCLFLLFCTRSFFMCVFKTRFIVYLQMKWPTLSGDECRQIHTHLLRIQNARSRVNAWIRATVVRQRVYYVPLYRILNEIYRNDIENYFIYFTRSVSLIRTCR